jgi:exopolyphosphatase/guanosine-5'-triphosphate,3'-diphosphate pyrophosphatase
MLTVGTEPTHALQVTRLATRIFDLLERTHLLKSRDRELLQCAALLHDIGWSVAPTGKAHHKHSAKLIRRHTWENLEPIEIELVALTARYHRKKNPVLKHAPYARLDQRERRRVNALAALLRMADALDRSHTSIVRSLSVRFAPEGICLLASVRGMATEEEYGFLKKRDLFIQHFEQPITLDVRS